MFSEVNKSVCQNIRFTDLNWLVVYDCLNQNRLINKCFTKDSHNNTLKYNIITTDILTSYSGDSLKSLVFAGENGIIYQITNEFELFRI